MSRSSIANILKQKRKDSGLTVEAVCEALNFYGIELSKNALYNYESGYRQPDADTLMALCDIYQVEDVLHTFGYKNTPSTDESAPGDGVISLDESNHLLSALGLADEVQQLSSDDFAFLSHIMGLVEAWFRKGH